MVEKEELAMFSSDLAAKFFDYVGSSRKQMCLEFVQVINIQPAYFLRPLENAQGSINAGGHRYDDF